MRATAICQASLHKPVLVRQICEALSPVLKGAAGPSSRRPLLVDCTVGMAGHARALLDTTDCTLVGIDRDRHALAIAEEALSEHIDSGRASLAFTPYSDASDVLNLQDGSVDAVLLDAGVSSMQLDSPERGFSFRPDLDGPLDMRMNQTEDGLTAADVVNTYSESALASIIFHLGEERASRKIAKAIVNRRPITTTFQLAQAVRNCFPRGVHAKTKRDPSTKTFQAIRMHVNQEISELKKGLLTFERLLRPGGRMAVIAFHSLEDRIVKEFFWHCSGRRNASASGQPLHARLQHDNSMCIPSIDALRAPFTSSAVSDDWEPSLRLVITPDKEELAENPRCRSAKLRVAERTEALSCGKDAHGRAWDDQMLET